METSAPPVRPKRKDAHEAVAKQLVAQLMRYSGHGLGDGEDAAISLKEALDSVGYPYDGFAIGKKLDEDCWEVDAMLVDELDCAGEMVETESKKIITEWVAATGFEMPYKVGDEVVPIRAFDTRLIGKVHEIRMDGTVLIDNGGSGCPVVQWEDVQLKA